MAEIVSTPISPSPPRSPTIRPRIPVNTPERVTPSSRSISCPGAGLAAAKSSVRPKTIRTGRRSFSAAAAASGSEIISLPPNAPPSGSALTRTRSSDSPSISAIPWRTMNAPWVEACTTSVPSGSRNASADCGSR